MNEYRIRAPFFSPFRLFLGFPLQRVLVDEPRKEVSVQSSGWLEMNAMRHFLDIPIAIFRNVDQRKESTSSIPSEVYRSSKRLLIKPIFQAFMSRNITEYVVMRDFFLLVTVVRFSQCLRKKLDRSLLQCESLTHHLYMSS